MNSKRKHRPTGKKPPGGKRPAAGRPEGSDNPLKYGEVRALDAARLRVPDGTAPGIAELAGRALQRMYDAMMERTGFGQGQTVLKAATQLREEICGPLTQKVHVTGLEALTDEQLEAKHLALQQRLASETKERTGRIVVPRDSSQHCVPGCDFRAGHEGSHYDAVNDCYVER